MQSPENQTSLRESILEPVKCWITPLWKYKEPSKLQTTVVCPKISQCLLTFWIYNKNFWITKVTSAKFFFDQTGSRSAVQGFFWPLCLWNTSSYPASLQGCMNEWCVNENHTVHSVVKKNDSILQAVTATQNWIFFLINACVHLWEEEHSDGNYLTSSNTLQYCDLRSH